jgi:hypothetical protein
MKRSLGSWLETEPEPGKVGWVAPILPVPGGFVAIDQTEAPQDLWVMRTYRADRQRQTTRVYATVEEAKQEAERMVRETEGYEIRPVEEVMEEQRARIAARAALEDK